MSTLVFDSKKLEHKVKDGVLTLKYSDRDAFVNNSEIKKATFQEVERYKKDYCAAATEFSKEEALKALKKDKSIDTVKVDLPWTPNSYGKVLTTVKRKEHFRGMNGSPDVTKSTVRVKIKDPAVPSKSFISQLEDELTKQLLK